MMCLSSLSCIAILFFPASPATAFGPAASCRRRAKDGLHPSITTKLPQNTVTSSRSSNIFSLPSEFGAISASNAPPPLDPTLVEASLTRLPWETENNGDEEAITEEIDSEERWCNTRTILSRLWVLPRDILKDNGTAASKGEDRMLSTVPQLLRLRSEDVESSAKTVLSVLRLPPALLRKEPLLLTIQPDRLVRGFDGLILAETKKMIQDTDNERLEGIDEEIGSAVREACKDTPGLLLEAATQWKIDE